MFCELLADEGCGIPVVYVPGIDGTGHLMLGGGPRVAASFRLLRLCHRTGDSPRQDSYATLARSVTGILDDLGIERALLLAESFGGGIALQTALDFPDRIAGLALVNSFAFFDRRVRLGLSRLGTPLVPRMLFDWGRKRLAPRMLFGRHREPEALRAFRTLPGAWFDRGYRRRLALIAGLDLRPRLEEIRCPVLVVAGDRDRIVASESQALHMGERLPDAEVRIVPGGGHLLLPLAELPWTEWLQGLAVRARLTSTT